MPELRWVLGGGRVLELGRRVQVMGILNCTPDSFYDGGRYADPGAAIDRALALVEEGADIVDVGGESSRPPVYGEAHRVPAEEECRRVVPVIAGVRRQSAVTLSVDTTKAAVAAPALDAGADLVNDVSALEDEEMGRAVAGAGAGVILMHRRGSPATMQLNTEYGDVVAEVCQYLKARVERAVAADIDPARVALDPGIGFGKSAAGNRLLIRRLGYLVALGHPVVLGASRKSFIWKPLGLSAGEALEGSLAAAVLGVVYGAHAVRVHDVAATVRALRTAEAIVAEGGGAAGSRLALARQVQSA
ncbi:MAG: dihydropteroate synthase [Gemmatimonadota bacterium]